jgi:branched-chain amino acid transport system permease protein
LIGLASATIAAAILGLIAIRVRAIPFLMLTLAFGEIVYGTARHWSALTNGDNGINGIPPIEFAGIFINGAAQPVRFYYLALAVFVLCYWLLNKINRSSFGLAHQASKQSPKRLEALGYPVFWTKYTAFVICGFFAGVSGVLAAIFERVMHPESIWFGAIMFMLISAILGGINSRIGPLVGVTVAISLERNLEPITEHYRIVVGVIFLITILLVRQGIMGFIETTRIYKKFLHITGFD